MLPGVKDPSVLREPGMSAPDDGCHVNLVFVLGAFALLIVFLDAIGRWQRTVESVEGERIIAEVRLAEDRGTNQAIAQHPIIDVQKCIGCASCVKACPEAGVLGIVDGVARVIHGSRCIGHARCEEVCPVQAIVVGLGDISSRSDLPLLDAAFETSVPGIRIAGELGGMALIRIAVDQGTRAMKAFAKELRAEPRHSTDTFDVLIVGAGPAGFAATLQAKEEGLRVATIDRQDLGGTIRKYPRRKLTLTGTLTLPLHGKIDREEFLKEELIDLFEQIAKRHQLKLTTGLELLSLKGEKDGFIAKTSKGSIRARRILLALGRRGIPRRLGVPGEATEKVLYQLIDASSIEEERILVVGGGDSAVEAALALAEQRGNVVTLSYRREAFVRLKARNEQKFDEAVAHGKIRVLLPSTVKSIDSDSVTLELSERGVTQQVVIGNDMVYILAGGEPPYALLKQAGISFGGTGNPDATSEEIPVAMGG